MPLLTIEKQPDWTTCGPTALHAVYRYYGDAISLGEVIEQVPVLEGGGTLGVILGNHALSRGYRATLYTYNLVVFDPSWFQSPRVELKERLRAQQAAKSDSKLHSASEAYLEFIERGGKIRFVDLAPVLLRRHLNRGLPVLTGLSATYLYKSPREAGEHYDDIRGLPTGHFVVLTGYDPVAKTVDIADPLIPNPMAPGQHYQVSIRRLVAAILLGVLTYDANLLVLHPRS